MSFHRAASASSDAFYRRFERYETNLAAHAVQDGYEIPCQVMDISAGGARVRFDSIALQSFRGSQCRLQVPGLGSYPSEIRWRDQGEMGLAFGLTELSRSALATLLGQRFGPHKPTKTTAG